MERSVGKRKTQCTREAPFPDLLRYCVSAARAVHEPLWLAARAGRRATGCRTDGCPGGRDGGAQGNPRFALHALALAPARYNPLAQMVGSIVHIPYRRPCLDAGRVLVRVHGTCWSGVLG